MTTYTESFDLQSVTDSFDRANSTSTLGSTDAAFGGSVVPWIPLGSSVWGINGNAAYLVSAGTGQDLAVIESSLSDCVIELTFAATAACGVCWRVTDTDNNWVIDGLSSPPIVYKKVGGGFTAVQTFSDAGPITSGDTVRVVLDGNTHTIYRNGVRVALYSDAFNATATEHGLRSPADTSARFNNFKVFKLPTSTLGPDLTWTKFSGDSDPKGPGPGNGGVAFNSYGISGGDRSLLNDYSDSFNRANSATTMGDTNGAYGGLAGHQSTWFSESGHVWGISSNQAYNPAGNSNSIHVIEIGESNLTIEAKIVAGTEAGLAWRVDDSNNCWFSKKNGDIVKRVASVETTVFTLTTGAISDGDVLRIEMFGDDYQAWVNGTSAGIWTDSFNNTWDAYGFRAHNSSNARFDDFKLLLPLLNTYAFARADGNVGSTAMYTQAEITAIEISDPAQSYPVFQLGTSINSDTPALPANAYDGFSGAWCAVEPLGYTPSGCAIYTWLYDQPSDTYFSPSADFIPLGGDPSYVQGPILADGDVIRLEHNSTTRRLTVLINGVAYYGASYTAINNPTSFGRMGALGIEAFQSSLPYPGNVDRLDNFEIGLLAGIVPVEEAYPWPSSPADGSPEIVVTKFPFGSFPSSGTVVSKITRAGFIGSLADSGQGAVTYPLSGGTISHGDIVAFDVRGSRAFAMIAKSFTKVTVDTSEERAQEWQWSGPGHLAVFQRGVVGPPGGTGREPVIDDIVYDYTHPNYDDSGWGTATEVWNVFEAKRNGTGDYAVPGLDGRWGYLQVWQPVNDTTPPTSMMPDGSPTSILWASDGTIAGTTVGFGTCYFRDTFTTPLNGAHLLYFAADNIGTVSIDGKPITTVGTDGDVRVSGFEQGHVEWVSLSAGTHTIAISATNVAGPPGAPNPGGMAAQVWIPGYPPQLVWETTPSMKILEYQAEAPGMTPGQVFRLAIEEQQADGRFGYVTLGFSDTLDTDGNAWPIVNIATKIGTDVFTFFKEIGATHADIEMDPNGWTFNAWNWGTKGGSSGVTLVQASGSDPTSGNLLHLEQKGEQPTADQLLIRWSGGWSADGSGGDYQAFLELGPQVTAQEIGRIGDRQIAIFGDPREEIAVSYNPRNDSEVPWKTGAFVPGATVTAPDSTGSPVTERAIEVGVEWTDTERLVITLSLKDIILQAQERFVQMLKQ